MSETLKFVAPAAPETTQHRPWFPFFPADWLGDELLALCSMAARGLLASIMCLMHKATPYGYLYVHGKPPTDAELTRLVRATSVGEVRRLRAELVDRGVLSTTADGVLYSRKMVRKAQQSALGREHGKRGGNPALIPLTPTVNPPPLTEPLTVADNTQQPETKSYNPIVPVLPTDEALGERARGFLERYPAIYADCRAGAHYRPKVARDFPTAVRLVSAHPLDDRLDDMLKVFLRMDARACRDMNRPGTVNQFAAWAPECDRLLRENGR